MNEWIKWAIDVIQGDGQHLRIVDRVLIFLLERERDRKKEIRLEALTLLEEIHKEMRARCFDYEVDEDWTHVVRKLREELEGT